MHDVIIVGAGAAGLTAAIYSARRQLKTLVITQDIGGQTNMTPRIENYPGVLDVSGPELMQIFFQQAKQFGAEFAFSGVKKIEKKKERFTVYTMDHSYEARSIILAFGLTHKGLGLDGEQALYGKGISFCATCDGPLFKNKDVCVVGDSFMAMDACYYLSQIASNVHYIIRNAALLEKYKIGAYIQNKENISIHENAKVLALHGSDLLESIDIQTGNEIKQISCSGLFIKIALLPQSSWIADLVKTDKNAHILVNDFCATNVKGIFACGDICQGIYKQIVIAAGQGAKAALSTYKFLQDKETTQKVVDWTTH